MGVLKALRDVGDLALMRDRKGECVIDSHYRCELQKQECDFYECLAKVFSAERALANLS